MAHPDSSFQILVSRSQLPVLLNLRPGVAERHRAVEDQSAWRGIGVDAEVAEALELIARTGLGVRERRLDLGAALHLERFGIQVIEEVFGRGRVFVGEETIVNPHLGVERVRRRHPVQCRLHFAAVR